MSPQPNKRAQYRTRWGQLTTEFAPWRSQFQELSRYLLPYSGRFLVTDRNRGDKKFNNIYDSTGTRALRVLAAGLMAGMTSPARPWFRLATSDRDLMEYGPVKLWLNAVTEQMRDIFSRSNTYRALHSVYEELGVYGTGATIMLPDYETVIHHYPLTAGEYAISTNHRGDVVTLYREFELTVSQMVSDFGIENVSSVVKNLYDQGRGLDNWVPVIHVIEPRGDRDTTKRDAKNMAWKSCYFETNGNDDIFLRESGFKRAPMLVPRWSALGGDIYGNGPGMEALGDVKQLQHGQLRKAQGIDYMVKPPLQMPSSLKNMPVATLPGGAAFVDTATPGGGIKSMFDVRIDLSHLLEDIQDARQRINQTFYVDLFLMLAQADDVERTAREIAEKHEEKLLMLGPVLERLHNELLKKKINLTFDHMIDASIVPVPPPEMHDQELNVEFVSMLAQAQRAVGTSAGDRLVGTIGTIAVMQANAGAAPTALDKLDTDEYIDQYGEMLGVNPNIIVANDKVAIIRKNRAAAQAQQQQAAAVPQAAATAKDLSQADTSGKNALTDVIQQFSGYSTPQQAA